MLKHALGLRLGKTIGEIEEMTVTEFRAWAAYLELEADARF